MWALCDLVQAPWKVISMHGKLKCFPICTWLLCSVARAGVTDSPVHFSPSYLSDRTVSHSDALPTKLSGCGSNQVPHPHGSAEHLRGSFNHVSQLWIAGEAHAVIDLSRLLGDASVEQYFSLLLSHMDAVQDFCWLLELCVHTYLGVHKIQNQPSLHMHFVSAEFVQDFSALENVEWASILDTGWPVFGLGAHFSKQLASTFSQYDVFADSRVENVRCDFTVECQNFVEYIFRYGLDFGQYQTDLHGIQSLFGVAMPLLDAFERDRSLVDGETSHICLAAYSLSHSIAAVVKHRANAHDHQVGIMLNHARAAWGISLQKYGDTRSISSQFFVHWSSLLFYFVDLCGIPSKTPVRCACEATEHVLCEVCNRQNFTFHVLPWREETSDALRSFHEGCASENQLQFLQLYDRLAEWRPLVLVEVGPSFGACILPLMHAMDKSTLRSVILIEPVSVVRAVLARNIVSLGLGDVVTIVPGIIGSANAMESCIVGDSMPLGSTMYLHPHNLGAPYFSNSTIPSRYRGVSIQQVCNVITPINTLHSLLSSALSPSGASGEPISVDLLYVYHGVPFSDAVCNQQTRDPEIGWRGDCNVFS